MLLYISARENEALFSDWLEEQSIYMGFIPYDEFPSIKNALTLERAMPNYRFIFFHLTELPLPEDDIYACVEYIQRYFHARIIIFAPQSGETTAFFGRLIDIMDLRELVPVSEDTDILEELQVCLSPDGKSFACASELLIAASVEKMQSYLHPKLVIPENFRLTIGIAGTQSRVGVTTQVFAQYHALKALGFCPCVIDTRQAFIELLISLYPGETEIDGSVVNIRNIAFSHDIQAGTTHNAFIYDFGVLSTDNAPILEKCTLRFLCAGAKAWELPPLVKILKATPEIAQQIIFSFVASKDEKEVLVLLDNILPAAFAPWNPELWEDSEKEWHEKLLFPLLKEVLR